MALANTQATVSVAMCTFNGERFVARQLESIAAQTLPPYEVVICDDGSADATVQVVNDFIASHTGPTTFRLAHTDRAGGVRANFERAIAACTGDLIALSDQDDVWRQDRIAVAVAAIAGQPSVLAVNSNARIVDADGVDTGDTLFDALYVSDAEIAAINANRGMEVLIRRNTVTGATLLFRRALLTRALPLGEHWVHDEWLAAVAASVGGLRSIGDTLVDYRVHGGNAIGVVTPTLRNRLRQLRVPRGTRFHDLAARAAELEERLRATGAPDDVLALVHRKAVFERRRATYPDGRVRRFIPVLRHAVHGGYGALSSQGRVDILRDIVQPA